MSQEIIVGMKSLYNSPKCESVKDFLSVVSIEDIYSVCHTATNGKINPNNREEAIEAILLFTENLERFYSYQKIKTQYLKFYLQKNGIRNIEKSTKLQLVSDIYNFWDRKWPDKTMATCNDRQVSTPVIGTRNESQIIINSDVVSEPIHSSGLLQNSISEKKVQSLRSDIFAKEFVTWFYSNLNSVNDPSRSSSFDSTVFCTNSKLDIFFVSQSSTEEIHSEGSENCTQSFQSTVREHKLSFSPNTKSGTIAKESTHGLIKVFACGTLHISSNFIGIFEQEFGLVKNPSSGSWQIFYTNVNLKSGVTEVPSLPSTSVFEITNS